MMFTRSSGRAALTLFLFSLTLIVAPETIFCRQWETAKAATAYQQAQQKKENLDPQSSSFKVQLLECARIYRKVYYSDPHYRYAGEAIYEEGRIYQQLGDKFGDSEFYRTSVNRFNLLVDDYEGNQNCPDALFRMAAIYSQSLKDDESAEKAYQRLKTRYKIVTPSLQRSRMDVEKKPLSSDKIPVPVPQTSPTPKAAGPASRVTVQSVLTNTSDDSVRAAIVLDAAAEYHHEPLTNPNRVYFDIANAKIEHNLKRTMDVNDIDLQKIRISQKDPNTVRIVFDISQSSPYAVSELRDPFHIVIHFLRHKPAANTDLTTQNSKQIVAQAPSPGSVPEKSRAVIPATPAKQYPSDTSETLRMPAKNSSVDTNSGLSSPKSASSETQPVANKTIPAPPANKSKPASAQSEPTKKTPSKNEETLVTPKTVPSTSHGDRTLTRMLGLKINRIVLDPGHGGHDHGTIGPKGLSEKDLVLALAQDLQVMLQTELGAEVILTRNDDTYIPLEERTVIANQNHADLFVSIHANASRTRSISGVETYYLDFAKTDAEREIAVRENATASESISNLEDLIQKIAKADKSAESRELASIMQKKLHAGAVKIFPSTQNRGIRSAPFIVLIGANMPSILAEVAFISNPRDERFLKKTSNRKVLAKALYSGIVSYMETLGSDQITNQVIKP
jgi:N-acetylmuramoyl-L-alanine amidase